MNQKPWRSRRRLHADWTSRLRSGSGRLGAPVTVPFTKGFSFLGGGGAGAGRADGRGQCAESSARAG